MASSKIECNGGSFYNKVDKLSCHERCNIVHNVWLSEFKFIHC